MSQTFFDKSNGGIISPSIMCADLLNINASVELMKNLGTQYIHVDFMDNKFVPNITFGTDMVRALKDVNGTKRDIHIMAINPEQYFDAMNIGDGEIVAFHTDSCDNPHEVIANIRKRNAHPSIAISPDIDLGIINEYTDEIDAILLMTVYPGFAGRPMAEGSFDRIKTARKIIDKSNKDILLEVDGNVSWVNAPIMRECGGDMFVAGSSSIFEKGGNLEKNFERFNELVK